MLALTLQRSDRFHHLGHLHEIGQRRSDRGGSHDGGVGTFNIIGGLAGARRLQRAVHLSILLI